MNSPAIMSRRSRASRPCRAGTSVPATSSVLIALLIREAHPPYPGRGRRRTTRPPAPPRGGTILRPAGLEQQAIRQLDVPSLLRDDVLDRRYVVGAPSGLSHLPPQEALQDSGNSTTFAWFAWIPLDLFLNEDGQSKTAPLSPRRVRRRTEWWPSRDGCPAIRSRRNGCQTARKCGGPRSGWRTQVVESVRSAVGSSGIRNVTGRGSCTCTSETASDGRSCDVQTGQRAWSG